MKIPKKILDNFRLSDWGCDNDNWNIANGLPTKEQRAFLVRVYHSKYGICGGGKRLTMKDIKEYNEIHSWREAI
jgi:hypothetical protein